MTLCHYCLNYFTKSLIWVNDSDQICESCYLNASDSLKELWDDTCQLRGNNWWE